MSNQAFTTGDRQKLDNLMGIALLDNGIEERLLNGEADALLVRYALSRETRAWLSSVKPGSSAELAEAILSRAK